MGDYLVLLLVAAVLFWLMWLTQRKPAQGGRRPLTLTFARFLRLAGRWFWAVGEAVEIGFFRGRHVRDRISLDLDPSETRGER